MEQIVLPAQIFIQILISGIFMRKIAYTDSVFLAQRKYLVGKF